jgi:Glycosyl hydrolases family 38 N-terminal domain/Alpha mannosidase middle domain
MLDNTGYFKIFMDSNPDLKS